MGSARSNLSFGLNSPYNQPLMSISVLFVPFCCGYEQIIQFCSGIDMCVYIGTERPGICQWGECVSWEKSRSVIQLCARQEGNEEERNTEELREGGKEEVRLREEEKTDAVNTWREDWGSDKRNINRHTSASRMERSTRRRESRQETEDKLRTLDPELTAEILYGENGNRLGAVGEEIETVREGSATSDGYWKRIHCNTHI